MKDSNKTPSLFGNTSGTQNQSLFGGFNANTNSQQNKNLSLFGQSQSLFSNSNNQGVASPFASFSNTNNNGGLFGNKEEKPLGKDSVASPFGSLNNNSAFFGKGNNEKPLTTNNPFTSSIVPDNNSLFSNSEKPSLTTNNPFTTPLINNTNSSNNNQTSNNEKSLVKGDNPFISPKINNTNSLFSNNNNTSLFNNTNKQGNLFSNNNEIQKEEKKSLFDSTKDNKSLFNSSNINPNPSSLFTDQETNQDKQKTNLFGNIDNNNSVFSNKTENKTIFNNKENKTNQTCNLFGSQSTNNNDNSSLLNQNNPFNKPSQEKGLSLFGDTVQPKDEPKNSPFGDITNNQKQKSDEQKPLFSFTNEIGSNSKSENPQKKVDNPFSSSNLFNTNNIITEENKSNSIFNTSENNNKNIFQQSPSTPIESVNEEVKDVPNTENNQNEIVSPVKSPFSNLNSDTTFIQKSSSSTASVPLNINTTPGGLFSLHNNNSTFFIPPDALKTIQEVNKESSFTLLFTEYTNILNLTEKIKPISNDYNAIYSEIEKLINNITNKYTSITTLTEQNNNVYQDLITTSTSEELKKSIDDMKKYYELMSNLSFSTIHETISKKYKEFVKEWENATVDNKDNLKQINYKDNNVYIGEYEINDNDDHSQKIIIKNKGIVKYNNGNILIQEIINESEKKGIMFNDNENYIGQIRTENEKTVFEGIMINEKNIIFLGTFNLLEEEDAHNGLFITYDSKTNNLKINSSKKMKMIINKENNQMKCEFTKDNTTYHISIGKYVFKIAETESLCLFYQSKENSPIYLGVIEYNKEKKSYYPKNNDTNMLIYSNNDVYQGNLLANSFYIKNGKGKCILSSKQIVIEGEFENNIVKERIKIYPKGKEDVFFQGTHNKMKPKEGEIHYYNKDFYQGQFNDDFELNDKGKYIYNNNIVYEGEWKINNKNGKGMIIKDNGDKYEVEYENDKLIEFFE